MKQKLCVQIEYRKTEQGICIEKMHGRCAEVRIPEMIDGLPVVAVAASAAARMFASIAASRSCFSFSTAMFSSSTAAPPSASASSLNREKASWRSATVA